MKLPILSFYFCQFSTKGDNLAFFKNSCYTCTIFAAGQRAFCFNISLYDVPLILHLITKGDLSMPPEYNVRSVERALAILDCFDYDHASFSLVELAKEIDLSASTTLRLVSTLEKKNYLYRNPESGRYYLGARLAQLGNVIFANLDICQAAQPFMQVLCKTYNESVGIYQRHGDTRVCITRINSNQTLRSVLTIGSTYPLTRGAAGRILLAYSDIAQQERLLAEDPFTTKEALEAVRKEGFTISKGERDAAVESIAAPVFSGSGQVEYSLFITGPAGRFENHLRDNMISDLKEAALQLSIQLGYRPPKN